MFVGTTGVQRVLERSAELTRQHGTEDIWRYGGIPLPVIQKYLNFHFSVSMDLFGSEVSTNAANYFSNGLKGRWMETRRKDDHVLTGLTMSLTSVRDGAFVTEQVPMLNALNLDLRNEYAVDCSRGVKRWNGALEKAGVDFRLLLPHEGFNRRVGAYAGSRVTPDGRIVDDATWQRSVDDWLPTEDDRRQVAELMKPEYEPGRFAGWIAPPAVGINEMPVEFDYVHF